MTTSNKKAVKKVAVKEPTYKTARFCIINGTYACDEGDFCRNDWDEDDVISDWYEFRTPTASFTEAKKRVYTSLVTA